MRIMRTRLAVLDMTFIMQNSPRPEASFLYFHQPFRFVKENQHLKRLFLNAAASLNPGAARREAIFPGAKW